MSQAIEGSSSRVQRKPHLSQAAMQCSIRAYLTNHQFRTYSLAPESESVCSKGVHCSGVGLERCTGREIPVPMFAGRCCHAAGC